MANRLSEQPGELQARQDFITRGRRMHVLERVSGVGLITTGSIETVTSPSITKSAEGWLTSMVSIANSGGESGSVRMTISVVGLGIRTVGNWKSIPPGQTLLIGAFWWIPSRLSGLRVTVVSTAGTEDGTVLGTNTTQVRIQSIFSEF